LKDAGAKPLTDEELERVIRELYFEKVERIVKQYVLGIGVDYMREKYLL